MINDLVKEIAFKYSSQKEAVIKEELIRFLEQGLVYIEETKVGSYLDCGELKMVNSIRLRVKNDEYILQLEKQLAEQKDHCEVCQCNEWLCGHNERE